MHIFHGLQLAHKGCCLGGAKSRRCCKVPPAAASLNCEVSYTVYTLPKKAKASKAKPNCFTLCEERCTRETRFSTHRHEPESWAQLRLKKHCIEGKFKLKCY